MEIITKNGNLLGENEFYNMIENHYNETGPISSDEKLKEIAKIPFNEAEGAIDCNGNFYLLEMGGHNQLMLYLASKETQESMSDVADSTPEKYYADWETYLESLGNSIAIRQEFQTTCGKITLKQKATLIKLQKFGIIKTINLMKEELR